MCFLTQRGEFPLMLAVQGGDEEIVAVLVEGGANVNTQTEVSC